MRKTSPELLDRLPPADIEAEQQVVGSLLLAPSKIRDVAGVLSQADFYNSAYGILFRHLVEADEAGEKIDVTLLVDRLKRSQEYEAAGGAAEIAACMQATPIAYHALYYAQIVARKAAARRNIHVACELLRASYAEESSPEQIADSAINALQQGLEMTDGTEPKSICLAAVEAFERAERAAERRQGFGLATGLPLYDDTHGGLFPGELIVIAARPSMGKTSLALQIAWYCGEARRPVYFASAEMSAVELASRVICGHSAVNSRRLRTGTLCEEELSRMNTTANRLGQHPCRVDDYPRLTATRIRRCCRKLAAQDGLRLVIVDYLQRLSPEDTKLPRHQQIGEQVRELKSLAKELDVPVLCVVQLNRESRKDTRPRLHHLGDSGEIEREADVVGFLHEPEEKREYAPTNAESVDIDLSVDKNRNGETGRIELEFLRHRTLFACAGIRIETALEGEK